MKGTRPKLAFISPVFLFPADAGGKIRSGNILRGMLGGHFEITLASPALPEQQSRWSHELAALCDHFVPWEPNSPKSRWQRALSLWTTPLPVNVEADRTPTAQGAIENLLRDQQFDVIVFDFVHSAVLRPQWIDAATVCFTHNVEAEIFKRHAKQARSWFMRRIWESQHRKMQRYEAAVLRSFTSVIAVSQRDSEYFEAQMGVPHARAIPTGVDLDFFQWHEPTALNENEPRTVIFTGSMDWEANIDGVDFFLNQVWPLVLAQEPLAQFVVVGRRPSPALLEAARGKPGLRVTGFVDDVRPHVRTAHVFVIPLRVGGGTRIKAFEAMAMGCPVVSTTIGIEGLDVSAGEHYLEQDTPAGFANAILTLLHDAQQRAALSKRARSHVEASFGHHVAARAFEKICIDASTSKAAPTPAKSRQI